MGMAPDFPLPTRNSPTTPMIRLFYLYGLYQENFRVLEEIKRAHKFMMTGDRQSFEFGVHRERLYVELLETVRLQE